MQCITAWNYNMKSNMSSSFYFVTMYKVAIIFFEFGVVKYFMQKF